VAEINGEVVGHALFSPRSIRMLDADMPAVCLGPIAVVPEYQRQGIGGAMIEEGHRIAAAKGNVVSFLIGHRTYYPRFGYRTNAYGSVEVPVPVDTLPDDLLEESPVRLDDAAELHDLWRMSEGGVDFAVDPGRAYLDWVSPDSGVANTVYRRGDEIAGYARYGKDKPEQPRILLARDVGAARSVAATLARHTSADTLRLPIHPRSAGARAFPAGTVQPMEAAMARELEPGVLARYFDAVTSGSRPLGCVTWPVEFDI
jgi:hypothetical protein